MAAYGSSLILFVVDLGWQSAIKPITYGILDCRRQLMTFVSPSSVGMIQYKTVWTGIEVGKRMPHSCSHFDIHDLKSRKGQKAPAINGWIVAFWDLLLCTIAALNSKLEESYLTYLWSFQKILYYLISAKKKLVPGGLLIVGRYRFSQELFALSITIFVLWMKPELW